MSTKNRIYLDHAASTPVDSRVLESMLPYFSDSFANPGGLHQEALAAKKAVAESRLTIARSIGARADEIICTASGTEANALAIFGLVRKLEDEGRTLGSIHLVTSVIEHPSVLDAFRYLERRGAAVDYIGMDSEGILDLKELERTLRRETVLVSIMLVNNEIGTIQPIEEVAKAIRRFKKKSIPNEDGYPLLHTDASQGALFLEIDAVKNGIDLLTIDGQKVYGPKGIGALYKKRGVQIAPLFFGGKQEGGFRAGTENVPGIVGFAKALELAGEERVHETARLAELRDYGIKRFVTEITGAELNGSARKRLPNNINISISGKNNELMVLELDARGIAAGTRSACLDPASGGSYVIEALGKGAEAARSSLRFTMGKMTRKEDIDRTVDTLKEIVDC